MTNLFLSASQLKKIQTHASELGFDLCSAAPAVVPDREKESYLQWVGRGGAAGMDYMTREPERRLDVGRAFPDMKTVLSLGVSYFQGPVPDKPGRGYGRVARYAWGIDYHEVIPIRLQILLKDIETILGRPVKSTTAVDTKPLLERAMAQSAGLGFVGKNTMLIAPHVSGQFHVGSWVFLSEILLDVPFEGEVGKSDAQGCGGCTKCLTSCPTDAFDGPYKLKSEKCISYLTIENKGWIPENMREAMGEWVYGCDVCQDICPFNARAKETIWPEFQPDKGVGAWMSLRDILNCPDQATFKKMWGHTPLSRAKRKGLVRNACVAAGNSGDETLVPVLDKLLNDEEPLIRGHAVWALEKLGSNGIRVRIERMAQNDPDEQVRQECNTLLCR